MPPIGTRKDMQRVTLKVAGHDFGEWETKTGGKTSANSTLYKQGAMQPARSLGGVPTTDTITLTRDYDERDAMSNGGGGGGAQNLGGLFGGIVDNAPQEINIKLLHALIGAAAIVRHQPLGPDGNPYGPAAIYDGILDAVSMPDSDANSQDKADTSVDIAVNGVPTFV